MQKFRGRGKGEQSSSSRKPFTPAALPPKPTQPGVMDDLPPPPAYTFEAGTEETGGLEDYPPSSNTRGRGGRGKDWADQDDQRGSKSGPAWSFKDIPETSQGSKAPVRGRVDEHRENDRRAPRAGNDYFDGEDDEPANKSRGKRPARNDNGRGAGPAPRGSGYNDRAPAGRDDRYGGDEGDLEGSFSQLSVGQGESRGGRPDPRRDNHHGRNSSPRPGPDNALVRTPRQQERSRTPSPERDRSYSPSGRELSHGNDSRQVGRPRNNRGGRNDHGDRRDDPSRVEVHTRVVEREVMVPVPFAVPMPPLRRSVWNLPCRLPRRPPPPRSHFGMSSREPLGEEDAEEMAEDAGIHPYYIWDLIAKKAIFKDNVVAVVFAAPGAMREWRDRTAIDRLADLEYVVADSLLVEEWAMGYLC